MTICDDSAADRKRDFAIRPGTRRRWTSACAAKYRPGGPRRVANEPL